MTISTDKPSAMGLKSAIQRLWRTASVDDDVSEGEAQQTLTAYRTSGPYGMTIVAAPVARPWMDESPGRFAYHCLPMLIANQSGWLILNDVSFEAVWDGSDYDSGVTIRFTDEDVEIDPTTLEFMRNCVTSHFGCGILTWTLPYLFQTPDGYSLLARGPANWPTDGVSPLEGIVETDQAASTFTMNWKMTRPGFPVRFDRGAPICMIVPQRRGEMERFAPKINDIQNSGPLLQRYKAWEKSRSQFLSGIEKRARDAMKQGWQKHYFRGEDVDNSKFDAHTTKVKLREFVEEAETK